MSIGTDGLPGGEVGLDQSRLAEFITVGDFRLPVASLEVEVEGQAVRALDLGQTDDSCDSCAVAANHVLAVALGRQAEELVAGPVDAELVDVPVVLFVLGQGGDAGQ